MTSPPTGKRNVLAMRKQREFIEKWIKKNFFKGAVWVKEWANDSRCTITDGIDDMDIRFVGRCLVVDGKPAAYMPSPRAYREGV